jgi:hypothetical protein
MLGDGLERKHSECVVQDHREGNQVGTGLERETGNFGGRHSWQLPTGICSALVQPARLEVPLLDPELRRHLRLVNTHLDETLGVLARMNASVDQRGSENGKDMVRSTC